jgi:hypothetical protein
VKHCINRANNCRLYCKRPNLSWRVNRCWAFGV